MSFLKADIESVVTKSFDKELHSSFIKALFNSDFNRSHSDFQSDTEDSKKVFSHSADFNCLFSFLLVLAKYNVFCNSYTLSLETLCGALVLLSDFSLSRFDFGFLVTGPVCVRSFFGSLKLPFESRVLL